MPETHYQSLPENERREALEVAEISSGSKAHLLEKDIWIVAALGVLFESQVSEHLIFKGGFKAWKVSHKEAPLHRGLLADRLKDTVSKLAAL